MTSPAVVAPPTSAATANTLEIFTRVKQHLLTQNARAVMRDDSCHNGERCAYRGADGLKCAVGCLIPDDKYTPDIEYMMVAEFPEDLLGFSPTFKQMDLLRRLQGMHDEEPVAGWAGYLADLEVEVRGGKYD